MLLMLFYHFLHEFAYRKCVLLSHLPSSTCQTSCAVCYIVYIREIHVLIMKLLFTVRRNVHCNLDWMILCVLVEPRLFSVYSTSYRSVRYLFDSTIELLCCTTPYFVVIGWTPPYSNSIGYLLSCDTYRKAIKTRELATSGRQFVSYTAPKFETNIYRAT